MFDLNKIASLPDGERAKAEAAARELLMGLEAARQNSRDSELVWIENKFGVRDVVDFGYYRGYIQKNSEDGYRLLSPEEVADEQEKVRQSQLRREEKQGLWTLLTSKERDELGSISDVDIRTLQAATKGRTGGDPLPMDEVLERVAYLEELLEKKSKKG